MIKTILSSFIKSIKNVSVDDSKSKRYRKREITRKGDIVLGQVLSLITQRAIICQYIEENQIFIISVKFVGEDFCS